MLPHGQAAGRAQRHVVELLDRREHLGARLVGDRGRPLEDARDGGDGDAGALGDGVDRRSLPTVPGTHRARLPR